MADYVSIIQCVASIWVWENMKSGILSFCILMLIYLVIAGILLILGHDITNDRLIVFIALAATTSSLIDFLNEKKSKIENELLTLKDAYRIKDKIKVREHNLVNKYDFCRSLFMKYIHQVFSEDELDEIRKNNLSEEKKKLYCKRISTYNFDDTELKEMMKHFVDFEISPDVEEVVDGGDYTGLDEIIKTKQTKVDRYEQIINIAIGSSVFLLCW